MVDEHVVVVGAGPAGLAAAWAIRRAGLDPLVVEQAGSVAASWRKPRWPGMAAFPGIVIHAGQFRNVSDMAGLDVLVVAGWRAAASGQPGRTAPATALAGCHCAGRAAPDAVICATGYRADLERLAGHLVALDKHGMPSFTGASSSPQLPGLWFFGLDRSIYGNMHIHRRQAPRLAQAFTRQSTAP